MGRYRGDLGEIQRGDKGRYRGGMGEIWGRYSESSGDIGEIHLLAALELDLRGA